MDLPRVPTTLVGEGLWTIKPQQRWPGAQCQEDGPAQQEASPPHFCRCPQRTGQLFTFLQVSPEDGAALPISAGCPQRRGQLFTFLQGVPRGWGQPSPFLQGGLGRQARPLHFCGVPQEDDLNQLCRPGRRGQNHGCGFDSM